MSLGRNILKSRKDNGLSQEQLSEKINVSRQTISNWEMGETYPNAEQLKILSKELKVSVDELLENDYFNDLKKESICKEKTPKKLNILEILFLVLGSPIWLSLLIVIIAIFLTTYIVLWAAIVCLWAVFFSLICCALLITLSGGVYTFALKELIGLAMIGAGIVGAGMAIYMFYGCKVATKGIGLLTKKSVIWIKNYLTKKEES
ncbi:MAG: helix-turn-helix domain-containing protein [Firmicutes bacterium]|nr:helix-turn-helix domain-containing protein [Bacillota bacterium]